MIRARQGGFVLPSLVAVILPLILIIGASMSMMSGRNRELIAETVGSRALLAAQSGISDATYRARIGALDLDVPVHCDLGDGESCTVVAQSLRGDGVDNDGDGYTDELDEDIVRLFSTGRHGRETRKITTFLGKTVGIPAVPGELTLHNVKGTEQQLVNVDDSSEVVGYDEGNQSAGGVPGIIAPIGSTAYVTSHFGDADTAAGITGTAPSSHPNIAEYAYPMDLEALADIVRNAADEIVTAGEDNAYLGSAKKNDFRVTYGEGNIYYLQGGVGAGLLVVRGELKLAKNFRFDGLIICLGKMRIHQNSIVNGAVILATHEDGVTHTAENMRIRITSNSKLQYSSKMMDMIKTIMPGGRYVRYSGWQEVSKQATVGY